MATINVSPVRAVRAGVAGATRNAGGSPVRVRSVRGLPPEAGPSGPEG